MDNKELKRLRRRIVQAPAKEAGAADAPDFAWWHKSTGTAALYRYRVDGEFKAVVKVYGLEFGSLYRQEIQALHSLRATGRVCPVLADSHRHDPRYWDNNFEGPYFIAKPLYLRDLAKALDDFHWFEGLDIATQQADISSSFFKYFWKDYDARLENDAIDDNGRIVRVDLDAAFPLSVFTKADKLNTIDHRYFALRERDFVESIKKEKDEVPPSAEFDEVSALAIRISTMYVGRKHVRDFEALLLEMQEALPPAPQPETAAGGASPEPPAAEDAAPQPTDAAAVGKWAARTARLGRTLRSWVGRVKYIYTPWDAAGPESDGTNGKGAPAPVQPDAPTQLPAPVQPPAAVTSGTDVKAAILNRWLALWIKGNPVSVDLPRLSASPDKMVYLTLGECRLLATFLYYLIAEPKHGFSLVDLKASLLMLTSAFLYDRSQLIRERESRGGALLKEFSPNTHFFSLRQAIGERSDAEATVPFATGNGDAAAGALPAGLPTPALKAEIKAVGGRHWKAKSKSQCEDRAVYHFNKEGRVAFAAVADGASGAGGLKAAEVIEEELTRRAPRLQAHTPQQADAELRDIISHVNGELIRWAKEVAPPPQAMLVMAVASVRDGKCYVNIAHAGDSHCVVYAPDGSVVRHTANWRTRRLGEAAELRDGDFLVEYRCLNELPNFQEGTYRVRLYTDGVREEGFYRIRSASDLTISKLVDEAEQWPGSLRSVGEDDWAIAGIDIHVAAAESPSAGADEGAVTAPAEAAQPPAGLKLSNLLAAPGDYVFHLSEDARAFWRVMVAPYSNRQEPARFSLIRAAVGDPAGDPASAESPSQGPAQPAQPAAPEQEEEQPRRQEAVVTLVTPAASVKPLAATMPAVAAAAATDSRSVDSIGRGENQRQNRKMLVLIVCIIIAVFPSVIYLAYKFIYRPLANTNQSPAGTAPGAEAQTSPTPAPKLNDLQQQIKSNLTNKSYYFHDGLNKGSEEIDDKVKSLLDEVAAALAGTDYQITIYAFSPPKGESKDNRLITRVRAGKMSKYLEDHHKIRGVKFAGGGLPVSANLPPQLRGSLPRTPQGASVVIVR